eukprot:TRINITY_DN13540_c0_g1_i19.p1 TRINITY_DN13540_c0_g1~~TRINITY_DN13540_c0_g1_i19.p1  ORF type:complete len:233 (-),score=70.94 TRINITY_DN13540_c0_g1_i19:773-1387(-)
MGNLQKGYLKIKIKSCTNASMLQRHFISWAKQAKVREELKTKIFEFEDPNKSFNVVAQDFMNILMTLTLTPEEIKDLVAAFKLYFVPVIAVAHGDEKFLRFLVSWMEKHEEKKEKKEKKGKKKNNQNKFEEYRLSLYQVATRYHQEGVLLALLKDTPSYFTFATMNQAIAANMEAVVSTQSTGRRTRNKKKLGGTSKTYGFSAS